MKVKYKESYYREQELDIEEAITKEINSRVEIRYDSEDYIYELANSISTLENIITNMLKDMSLDKINKYLETNFEEVL